MYLCPFHYSMFVLTSLEPWWIKSAISKVNIQSKQTNIAPLSLCTLWTILIIKAFRKQRTSACRFRMSQKIKSKHWFLQHDVNIWRSLILIQVVHKKTIRFQDQKVSKPTKQKSNKELTFSTDIKNKPSTKIKIQSLKWDLNSLCMLCPADPC